MTYEEYNEFDTDFTETEAPAPPPVVPDGTYPAVIEDVQMAVGQASGNSYIHVTFRLLQQPYDEIRIHDRGRNFSFSPSPNVKARTKARLEQIMGEEIPRAPFRLENYRHKLVGRTVQLKTKKELFNDAWQNAIDRIMPGQSPVTAQNIVPTPAERKREGVKF